jgi:hypothetical protein
MRLIKILQINKFMTQQSSPLFKALSLEQKYHALHMVKQDQEKHLL